MELERKTMNMLMVSVVLLSFTGFLIWWFSGYRMEQKSRFTMAVCRGCGYEGIAGDFQRVDEVKSYPDFKQLWSALVRGQVDVVLADGLQGSAAKNNEHFFNLKPAGRVLTYELRGVAFRREDNSLRQAINQGLSKIIENRIFAGMSQEYFGRDITTEVLSKSMDLDEPVASDGSWERIRRGSKLRLAFRPDNPPFSYLNKHRKLTGFDVEIAWAICIQLGIRYYQPVAVKSDQLLQELGAKRIDGAWGVEVNRAMKMKVGYSNPYRISGAQLFVRKDSPIDGPEFLVLPAFPEPPPSMEFIQSETTRQSLM